MNIEKVSISEYLNMEESSKIKFYRQILDDTPKAQKSTQYKTPEKIAPQAKVPAQFSQQEDGELTFIAPLKRSDKKITSLYFLCVCSCGNWMILESNAYRKKTQIKCSYCSSRNGNHIKDIRNQVFGQMKVLYPTEDRASDKSVYWMCECIDCGHQQKIITTNLKNGHLCAICGANSKGEYITGKLLKENNISFEKEKTFNNCKYPNSGFYAKFDFWVNNSYIIEIDGEHHYKPSKYGSNVTIEESQKKFLEQQIRDEYKNNWCKEHNIPIIRIPYFYYNINGIKLEDILLESSKFILTEKGKTFKVEK